MRNAGKKFFECEPELWDEINDVGLRSHYICAVYAARMMVQKRSGLIVNISSAGGLQYFFNVPYGVGKAAVFIIFKFTSYDLMFCRLIECRRIWR